MKKTGRPVTKFVCQTRGKVVAYVNGLRREQKCWRGDKGTMQCKFAVLDPGTTTLICHSPAVRARKNMKGEE